MGKSTQNFAIWNRVFSETPRSISFKLAVVEEVYRGYRMYRGFWRESLAKPEIVKT